MLFVVAMTSTLLFMVLSNIVGYYGSEIWGYVLIVPDFCINLLCLVCYMFASYPPQLYWRKINLIYDVLYSTYNLGLQGMISIDAVDVWIESVRARFLRERKRRFISIHWNWGVKWTAMLDWNLWIRLLFRTVSAVRQAPWLGVDKRGLSRVHALLPPCELLLIRCINVQNICFDIMCHRWMFLLVAASVRPRSNKQGINHQSHEETGDFFQYEVTSVAL